MAISDYSTTPASNTSLSGINVPPVPPSRPKATQAPQSPAAATRSPPSNATAVNTRGETVSKQTGTFYNPDTNKFEQRTVYR